MIEKKLTLSKVEPVLLFGHNDHHLRKVESAYEKTRITARGNELYLKGEVQDLAQLERIFEELSLIVHKNGHLTDKDVDTVLDLARLNGGSKSGEVQDAALLFTQNGGLIRPKNEGQRKMVQAARSHDIVFAIGPAGTGKTYIAVALAVAALKSRLVKRIVLARPAVEAGESLGFLPGDLRDKIDPYLRPLYDALEDMLPPDKLRGLMEQNLIEIVPLAYMRGRTLNSAFVILDEAQNATNTQMKMFLTRLGANSRAMVTGDITQTDLPKRSQSGLIHVQEILEGVEGISFVYLKKSDVVRHQLVQDIIEAYDRFDTDLEG
ncbi:MAG: PhoH family protein [Bacteroidetes Order II. Incertae sedis bacterium]|nr:PhoH family protein [Bacteroidetes Order II. bacterium]